MAMTPLTFMIQFDNILCGTRGTVQQRVMWFQIVTSWQQIVLTILMLSVRCLSTSQLYEGASTRKKIYYAYFVGPTM